MKILLVEDDKNLSESLKDFLEIERFEVDIAFDSKTFYEKSYHKEYDLYIVDVNIPGDNGFKAIEYLKEANDQIPVIFITALRDIDSITKGFNLGAIDYIKKPFEPQELILRINSFFAKNDKVLIYKDIEYNLKTKNVTKNNQTIPLGEVQLKLFDKLIQNKNSVVSKDELMNFLKNPSSNSLRVALNTLKNKLDLNIKNIRGRGYMLEEI